MKKTNLKRKKGCIIFVLLVFCLILVLAAPCGDVNSDGEVGIVDALLIAQHYVNLDPDNFDPTVADVDGDSDIDIVDALLVARFYVNLIDELTGCPTPTPGEPETVFAVNCGGNAYTASDGTEYSADTGFSGGSTAAVSDSISGTPDQTLYQSERYGDSTYSAEVPNGDFLVTLHFAENYHNGSGLRAFNVLIEGIQVISNLDIYSEAGAHTALVQEFQTIVSDGEITIQCITTEENALINVIKVDSLSLTGEPVVRFTVNPANPEPDETVTVDASGSYDTNGTITGYDVSWGDNTTTNGPVTTHAYSNEGTYTITVTVTDNENNSTSKSEDIRVVSAPEPGTYTKPRLIITTDMGADPDDQQSLVHFLVCANEFDIEGIITATGCWKKSQSGTGMADRIIDAYDQVYDNLTVHADGYPTPEYLRSISVLGQRGYGINDVGSGKDSAGSEMIIAAVDKNDPRPVWTAGWGGCNNMAQALWKVQNTRSAAEVAEFVSKIRVYDILGQDNAGTWIAKTFPDIFYIRALYNVFGWPPSDGWLEDNVQNHGPLGAEYPDRAYSTEGDSPSFLYVYPNGLNDPEKVDQGSWGGRFNPNKISGIRGMQCMSGEDQAYDPYYMYGQGSEGQDMVKRWSDGINNDLGARMDWSINSNYGSANHHPVAILNGDTTRDVLYTTASPGSSVSLSAAGSNDPDGDSLNYSWSFYSEPSSYSGSVSISNSSSSAASVSVPSNAGGRSIHIVLTIRDNGSPNLYVYRRMIIIVN